MPNQKIILDKDNYIAIDHGKLTLVENESKFWNVFVLGILSIACYFQIVPIWGYLIMIFIIILFSLLKTITVIDFAQNTINKITVLSFYNITLTRRVIANNLTNMKFTSSIVESSPNEGSSMTIFLISIKDSNRMKEEILIQLDNKKSLDLTKKILEQNGLIVE